MKDHLNDLDLNELRDMRARIEGELSRREREREAQLAKELRAIVNSPHPEGRGFRITSRPEPGD